MLPKGTNTRFVVTTRDEDPTAVYDWYVDRGETENGIKDLKTWVLPRPAVLPSLPGQPVSAAIARRLLAARHPAPLADALRRSPHDARDGAAAAAQDRRLGA